MKHVIVFMIILVVSILAAPAIMTACKSQCMLDSTTPGWVDAKENSLPYKGLNNAGYASGDPEKRQRLQDIICRESDSNSQVCPAGVQPLPPGPPPGGPPIGPPEANGQINPAGGPIPPGNIPGGMPPCPPKLLKEDLEKADKFLKENDPVKYKDIQEIKGKDELLYEKIMSEVFRDMIFLERMKKENPDLYKNIIEEKRMESSLHSILRTLKSEKNAEKIKSLKEDVKKCLSKIFDLRQAAREDRLKKLEGDIQELRKKNESRKKNKDKIVELRYMEVMGRFQDLEW